MGEATLKADGVQILVSLEPHGYLECGGVQRLNLLYGEKGTLTLTQITPERILAKVTFPIES